MPGTPGPTFRDEPGSALRRALPPWQPRARVMLLLAALAGCPGGPPEDGRAVGRGGDAGTGEARAVPVPAAPATSATARAPEAQPAPRPCALSGRVELPAEAGMPAVELDVDGQRGRLELRADGTFLQEVPCGPVRLLAAVAGTRHVLWEGLSPAEGLVLQAPVQPGLGRLEVWVRGEQGPLRGAEVRASPMGPRRARGEPPAAPPPPQPPRPRQAGWSPRGLTDGAGLAVLPGLAPGMHMLEVTAPGHAPFVPYGVEVLGDVTRAEVVLVRGVRIAGRLVNERGRGMRGVFVEAVPLDEAGRRHGTPAVAEPGPGGAFVFPHLAPAARYRLQAHPVDGWLNPGPVEVTAGAGPAVVRLISPPYVWGRVLGWDGKPPGYFEVDGLDFEDPKGRFRVLLSSLEGVEVTAPGHLPLKLTPPETGGDLGTLRLERPPLTAWRVVDEAGRAVVGASVAGEGLAQEGTLTDAQGGFSLDARCQRIRVRQGYLRGQWRAGDGSETRVITLRAPSHLRARAYGPGGAPAAHGTWMLSCDPSWEDLPGVLEADAQGALSMLLPQGTCSLSQPRPGGDRRAPFTARFVLGPQGADLALGEAPGTSTVTLEMPRWAPRVRVTTVPPSDRAWEGTAENGNAVIPGLPPGRYSARWTERPRGRRQVDAEFDVPAPGPVKPPEP